jgi:hypothetical protein
MDEPIQVIIVHMSCSHFLIFLASVLATRNCFHFSTKMLQANKSRCKEEGGLGGGRREKGGKERQSWYVAIHGSLPSIPPHGVSHLYFCAFNLLRSYSPPFSCLLQDETLVYLTILASEGSVDIQKGRLKLNRGFFYSANPCLFLMTSLLWVNILRQVYAYCATSFIRT